MLRVAAAVHLWALCAVGGVARRRFTRGDEPGIAAEVLADVAVGDDVAVGAHPVRDSHPQLDDYVGLVVQGVVEIKRGVGDQVVNRREQTRGDVLDLDDGKRDGGGGASPGPQSSQMVFESAAIPPTARAAEATTVAFRKVRRSLSISFPFPSPESILCSDLYS